MANYIFRGCESAVVLRGYETTSFNGGCCTKPGIFIKFVSIVIVDRGGADPVCESCLRVRDRDREFVFVNRGRPIVFVNRGADCVRESWTADPVCGSCPMEVAPYLACHARY